MGSMKRIAIDISDRAHVDLTKLSTEELERSIVNGDKLIAAEKAHLAAGRQSLGICLKTLEMLQRESKLELDTRYQKRRVQALRRAAG